MATGQIIQSSASILPFWDTAPYILQHFIGDNSTSNLEGNYSMTHGGFQTAPTEWDIVRYGPSLVPLPGLAILKSVGRKIRLDNKVMPGTDGVTSTFLGYHPVHFDFELLLWSEEQLSTMSEQALPLIFPGKGQPGSVAFSSNPAQAAALQAIPLIPTDAYAQTSGGGNSYNLPVQLQHPSLLFHAVRSVIFEAVEGPMPWRGHNDIFQITCKTIQWAGPVKHSHMNTKAPAAPAAIPGQPGSLAANNAAATQPSTNPSALAPKTG